ncbi:MAG: FkbM family methyltransferase [Rhizobiaceae bacterium]
MAVFNVHDLEIEVEDDQLSEPIQRGLTRGWYEVDEVGLIRHAVKPGDRVLDLGAGLGVTAMVAARIVGAEAVCAYEANPGLIDQLKRNLRRNDLDLEVQNVVLLPRAKAASQPSVRLNLGAEFWGSSVIAGGVSPAAVTEIPTQCLEDAITRHRANVLVMDIEGLEVEILETAGLDRIDKIIVEIHYDKVGRQRTNKAIFDLAKQGLEIDLHRAYRGVVLLTRPDVRSTA